MPLFNPKVISTALAGYGFEPSATQLEAARQWAELVRSSFVWRPKETALEADFKRYVVQDVLGYRSFDASGSATVVSKEAIGSGEVDLALGRFSPAQREVLAPFELKGLLLDN